jgi:hypothetical protein
LGLKTKARKQNFKKKIENYIRRERPNKTKSASQGRGVLLQHCLWWQEAVLYTTWNIATLLN